MVHSLDLPNHGLIGLGDALLIATRDNSIYRYPFDLISVEPQCLFRLQFSSMSTMRLVEDHFLYVIDYKYLTLFDLHDTKQYLSRFQLQFQNEYGLDRWFVIDHKKIYLTYDLQDDVFVHDRGNFTLQTMFKMGTKLKGIEIRDDLLYVCATTDRQILLLNKNTGKTQTPWKLAGRPISLHLFEDAIYIGCMRDLFILDWNGNELQRICCEFNWISGLWARKDRLYVADFLNERLVVFQRNALYV